MELIEKPTDFAARFSAWQANDDLTGYPFVENTRTPFETVRRALPMLNLGLVTSAGAYINGSPAFDIESRDGDMSCREIPIEVGPEALRYCAKGYDPAAVSKDRNAQIPIDRLIEYRANSVIGDLADVWWSVTSHAPNAAKVAEVMAPAIVERLARYQVNAALFVPASRLCHQTLGIVARAVEAAGIPTICISVDTAMTERVRPPRTAYYAGEFGSVAGIPEWREYQLRVLDEALRWLETFDQPGSRKLTVELESRTEAARGER